MVPRLGHGGIKQKKLIIHHHSFNFNVSNLSTRYPGIITHIFHQVPPAPVYPVSRSTGCGKRKTTRKAQQVNVSFILLCSLFYEKVPLVQFFE